VIEVTSAGGGSGGRLELKFAFPNGDLGQLRALLEGCCRRLQHGEARASMVRSVYFDDATLATCRANLAGIPRRRKLRLRWYDSRLPEREAHLEVKWRRGNLTGKHRFLVRGSRPLAESAPDELVAELLEHVPSPQREALALHPEAAALIEYRREHFLADDPRVRLTLDSDITGYDMIGRRRFDLRHGESLAGLVVLEVKCPPALRAEVPRVLAPCAPRRTRSSKYVQVCQQLGLVPGVGQGMLQ